jgi:uncharacterized MAPEG superfamily protein
MVAPKRLILVKGEKPMKPELMLLVWAVLLAFAQMLVAVGGATLQVGLPALAGNREGLAPCVGWAGRAARAHHNMLENLVLFAALVLVAVAAGKTNSTTLLGAQIFVWARLAYAVIYVAGIAWLRTAAWLVSVIGLALIFFQLV